MMDNILGSQNEVSIKSETVTQLQQGSLSEKIKTTTTIPPIVASKADLRSTKTELFNKLIASQSQQQMIVTTPNHNLNTNKNGAKNLNQTTSGINDININNNLSRQAIVCDSETQQQQNSSNNNVEQQASSSSSFLLPEDFKREPIVFAKSRNRWYTNEEVASILTNYGSHPEWQTDELQVRPKSGAVLLYSREKVRYRQDGYCWKKRKNGRTTREDHMKLKVQGIECIYGCYVHSAILPTFHRRCYWLLQNPDIVLVHYLNQPPDDQNKMMITFDSSLLEVDTRRSWTNEEIIEEIGSVFGGISQIQHTLNINFPPSSNETQMQRQQSNQHQQQFDRMIDSSPQSQTTTISEPMNEQIDMTILDHKQQQPSLNSVTNSRSRDQMQVKVEGENQEKYVDDEMMTTISLDDNNNDGSNNSASLATANQADGNFSRLERGANGHEESIQQDEMISMTFDIVNECNDEDANNNSSSNNGGSSQPIGDCFRGAYDQDTGQTGAGMDVVRDASASNVGGSCNSSHNPADNRSGSATTAELQTGASIEQNPCSPVTQIYNKIVDDIETYALPLEPNQFVGSSHYSLSISSLPVQSMDLGETIDHRARQNSHLIGGDDRRRQLQLQFQHHGQVELDPNGQQFGVAGGARTEAACDSNEGHPHHQPTDCSMDLVTCDLFGDEPTNQAVDRGSTSANIAANHHHSNVDGSHGSDEDDNLLLTDFNLPSSGQVVGDELGSSVVDSLTNVDDLRDLIMGISSNGNSDHANLLVDTNSLDLFNFKANDCEHQHQQQLDVKSSISDTDTLSRCSPMGIVAVPRCNSTGNAMQAIATSHHLVNSCTQMASNEFQHHHNHNHDHNHQQQQRQDLQLSMKTTSDNPNSSASCSPSPSSRPLRSGFSSVVPISSAHLAASGQFVEGGSQQQHQQYISSTAPSTSHSFIKLPLQQRQRSEQQEPSNSVLNSLLPKALSLDGSDCLLADAKNHRVPQTTSPIFVYEDSRGQQQQQHQNLLLIPSQISENKQQLGAQLSSTNIPLDNSSEILVGSPNNGNSGNNSSNNFQGSLAYNLPLQAQVAQSQPISGPLESVKRATMANSGLLPIVDYVPNWCNITGGAKVLIVGDWSSLLAGNKPQQLNAAASTDKDGCSTSSFCAIFDDLLVPATLIQDNVLRCYAPSHEQGFITLKVLYLNRIVSEQVLFEMRPSCVLQSANQLSSSNHPRNTQSGNQDPSSDNNNNNGNNNTQQQQQQHRSSTSSNQSLSSNSSHFPANQKPSGANTASDDSGSRVLTLAENIISAMHRKNSNICTHIRPDYRLTSSLDVESSDPYQQFQSNHQRQLSLKGPQARRLTGSRSLTRDSESSYATARSFGIMDGADPYWNQGALDAEQAMKPLSVVTDFMPSSHYQQQQQHHHHNHPQQGGQSNIMFSQKRSSSGFFTGQQSAFTPYLQRYSLASTQQVLPFSSAHHHGHNQTTFEPQNLTETSSSGMGSIVSSLSPSTSSLHSPSSICATNNHPDISGSRNCQSPCSCGQQSPGTPTSADFCEYFEASSRAERSFASLTLNDREQQELYEAAKVIQKAYRTYRGRKRQASELLVEPMVTSSLLGSSQRAEVIEQQQPHLDYGGSTGSVVGQQQQQQPKPQQALVNQVQAQQQQQPQPQLQSGLVKCYRDREMQAATIIQAYYRRYRQYVHYKRQQQFSGNRLLQSVQDPAANCQQQQRQAGAGGARLVVDMMPIVIDKATTSRVDRKRFKTAVLIGQTNGTNEQQQQSQSIRLAGGP